MATLARTLALAACLAACLAPAASADSIYWSSYTAAGAIRGGPLGGGTAGSVFPGENAPQGVVLDPANGRMFWADYGAGTIHVANLDGSGNRVLYPSEPKVTGIALDPATGKLYWGLYTSDSTGSIRIGNVNGDPAQTLFAGEASPQNVVVDPGAGKIYWTSYVGFAVGYGIRGGNLNGTGAKTLFGAQPNPEYYVTGLAIDTATNTLYWADETNPGLLRAGSASGGAARTVYGGLGSPGGVAIDPTAGRIYWTESANSIVRVGSMDGSATPQTLFGGETSPWYLAILRAPQGTSAPVITGSGALGQKLACSAGGWAGDYVQGFFYRAPRSFSYQWAKDGGAIDGAVSASYTPFVAGNYACTVTATNAGGSTAQTSAAAGIGAGTTAPPPKKAAKQKAINAGYKYFFAWNTNSKRNTLTRFLFTHIPKGSKLELRCHGKGCTFKRKKLKLKGTKANLRPRVKRLHLARRSYVELRISARNRITEVLRFTATGSSGGTDKRLCLPAKAKHPRRCR